MALSGEKIFSCKAVVIKINLELVKEEVWRRMIVPVNISFTKLHQAIQAAFGWKDYHLHEFYIYGEEKTDDSYINHSGYHKEGLKPLICLVGSEEDLVYSTIDLYNCNYIDYPYYLDKILEHHFV